MTFGAQGRTKQSFKDECDINNILRRYNATGQLPTLIKQNPKYGDFASAMSYQESLNTVLYAQEQFAALGAKVRDRFANDPQKFLEFASNPENADEMVKLGLATVRQNNDSNDDNNNGDSPKPTNSNDGKTDEK